MFIRILNAAGCSTAGGTNAAWSVGTTALDDLTKARNFFAHRNDQTAARLRAVGVAHGVATDRVESLLTSRAAGRPQTVVEDWIDELETVFLLMPA